jgi:hypothetical protein
MVLADRAAHQQEVETEEIKMIFRYILLFFPVLCSLLSLAQNETDLYRFSRTAYNGGARFEAMGGSFGALGADLSSSQINPAGYGRYSSSTAGISIYGASNNVKATFNDNPTKSVNALGGISNCAVVLTEDASTQRQGFLYKQFALGMNRIENLRSKVTYEGQQYASLLDQFTGQAFGYDPSYLNDYFPFSTFLAYETWAINYDPSSSSYYSLLNLSDVRHKRTIETQGGHTELFLSFSANYINKLYLGANIGFRYYNYEEQTTHQETLTDTSGTILRGFDYTYNLSTSGWGTNLKAGMIYLFSEAARVGLSIHTPTFSELTDRWSADMTSHFEDSSSVLNETLIPTGNYKYRIRNPWRFIGSLAYVFGTRGCINLDIEALDYRMSHFRSTKDQTYVPYDYKTENEYADEVFKPALNLRLGGELVVMSTIYLRGGMGYYGKAFVDEMDVENRPDLFVSCGAGVKTQRFQFDIGYKLRNNSRNYFAFSDSKTLVDQSTHHIVMSFSLLF